MRALLLAVLLSSAARADDPALKVVASFATFNATAALTALGIKVLPRVPRWVPVVIAASVPIALESAWEFRRGGSRDFGDVACYGTAAISGALFALWWESR